MLTLRCQSCRALNLEIKKISEGHSILYCPKCNRTVRFLSAYQAKNFARHLPTGQVEAVQGELLGGEV